MAQLHAPAVRDLQQTLAAGRFPRSAVAYTVIPPKPTGEFETGIFPIGTVSHVILQVHEGKFYVRLYRTTLEQVDGGTQIAIRDNVQALSLNNVRPELFPARACCLPAALNRCARALLARQEDLDSSPAGTVVTLPDHYIQWAPPRGEAMTEDYFPEQLMVPQNSPALSDLAAAMQAGQILSPDLTVQAPMVVQSVDYVARGQRLPDYLVVRGQQDDGTLVVMRVPCPDMNAPDLRCEQGVRFEAGEPIVPAVTARAWHYLAWQYATSMRLPGYDGVWLGAQFAHQAFTSTGHIRATVVEDVRPILGAAVSNEGILEVAAGVDGGTREPNDPAVIAAVRRSLRHFARFATDADIIAGLQPDATFLNMSLMGSIQCWAVKDQNGLIFNRRRSGNITADFHRVRGNWKAAHGIIWPEPTAIPTESVLALGKGSFAFSPPKKGARNGGAAHHEAAAPHAAGE